LSTAAADNERLGANPAAEAASQMSGCGRQQSAVLFTFHLFRS